MDNDFFIYFIFSILVYFITILLLSNNNIGGNLNFLKAIKTISILFPSIMSTIIVVFLFSNINASLSNNSIATETTIINSGLSILGILASVWIGLNIYNTVEKNEISKLVENRKAEIDDITDRLEDLTKIQVESSIAESQGNLEESIIHYNTMVNKYNTYDLSYVLRGNFMFKNKKYQEAISDYSIALFKNKENNYLYYDRGKCYFELANYSEAIIDFTKVIDSNLYLEFAIKNRAISYQKNNNFDKAIDDYTYIIKSTSPVHAIYNNRGYCYNMIGDFDSAIADFGKAIMLSKGKEKEYYYNRLYANMNLSNHLDIIYDVDSIISKFEETEGLYNVRRIANLSLGKKAEAEKDLKRYNELKKNRANGKEEAAIFSDEEDSKE